MSDISGGGLVLKLLFIVLGFLLCYFGYRLFRFSLFTVGFLGGGLFIALVASMLSMHDAVWLAFIVGGLLCGFISVARTRIGVFIAGYSGSFVLAILVLVATRSNGMREGVMLLIVASGLLSGIAASVWKKPGVVATTSLMGATLLACMVALLPLPSDDESSGNDEYDAISDQRWWTFYGVLAALLALGMLVQFSVTGRGNHHEPRETEQQREDDRNDYENLQTPAHGSSPV